MEQSGILAHPFTVEYIAPGVINERSSNGLLTIFTVDNGNPKTIDAWLDCVRSTIRKWPVQEPCYSLHDIRKAGLPVFEAQLQLRFREFLELRPDLKCLIALVVAAEPSDDMSCFRRSVIELGGGCEYQVFLTRDQAIAWLLRARY